MFSKSVLTCLGNWAKDVPVAGKGRAILTMVTKLMLTLLKSHSGSFGDYVHDGWIESALGALMIIENIELIASGAKYGSKLDGLLGGLEAGH